MYSILYALIIFIVSAECEIKIKDFGVSYVRRGDVGMVFYARVHNKSRNKYLVDAKMIKCVESLSQRDQYTDIQLIGGHMGMLEPWSVKIVTLIYPNMYLYNRKGYCMIGITLTNQRRHTRTIEVKIYYGSLVGEGYMPKEMKALYRGKTPKVCESPDLDPLENCMPVDCQMKYLGNRNYFNEKYKRCQDVASCISDSEEDNPNVAYLPTANRCKPTVDCLKESDLGSLQEGLGPNCTDQLMEFRMLNLRCNHGVMDNVTGMCVCEPGWTSGDIDADKYVPSLSVYHMCNIEVDSWSEANKIKIRNTIFAFMILAVMISMLVLLLTFCLYGLYTYVNASEDSCPANQEAHDSSDVDFDFAETLSGKCY